MPCHIGHQGEDQSLKEVGLPAGPVQTTQGSRELSLETTIRLDEDSLLEAVPLTTTYLLLLTYPRW